MNSIFRTISVAVIFLTGSAAAFATSDCCHGLQCCIEMLACCL